MYIKSCKLVYNPLLENIEKKTWWIKQPWKPFVRTIVKHQISESKKFGVTFANPTDMVDNDFSIMVNSGL